MGCGSSKADEPEEEAPVEVLEAVEVSENLHKKVHERLQKLKELDQNTKVPFILIELTGEADGEGEIEVCGKDEYGVYEALDNFFLGQWNCEKLDPGDLSEETKVPFCSAQYRWPGFATSGDEGMNNMGLMTMRLIDFVSGHLSWTLAVVNGGNVGKAGEVRETQVIFKAPHPMNLAAPHMMVELRSAGFIEICADMEEEHMPVLDSLGEYFAERFQAELLDGHEDFCDRYYKAGDGIFKGTSGSLDSNFGLLSVEVCDKVASFDGWSLVASSSGNYGENAEHSEQQLVFRRDYHPLGDAKYLKVIINAAGNIEVNGQKQKEIHTRFGTFLEKRMRCKQAGEIWEPDKSVEGATMCRRYTWEVRNPDVLKGVADITQFFENVGWEMQVCSQQMVKEEGEICHETEMLFRPGKTEVGTIEPHLFVELYAGEGNEELYEKEEETQVLANQRIRVRSIGPRRGSMSKIMTDAIAAVEELIVSYMGGLKDEDGDPLAPTFKCNVFLCRGRFENNLAQWTMRFCDWMVDKMGWNFVVCSLCNQGDQGQFRLQQLVFHYDGEKREIPVSLQTPFQTNSHDEWIDTPFPEYWCYEQVLNRELVQKVNQCNSEETSALQLLLDLTFKRTLTRDRQPDDEAPDGEEMPYRLVATQAFRSEHACLNHRLHKKREEAGEIESPFDIKTGRKDTLLRTRLLPGEAYLFHGTNPSSSMNILRTGFVLDHAGTTTGTMYGAGIYMAECSSKSDEYSRDAGGNTYPSLHALLVCRCFVGNPLVVSEAGDHTTQAQADGKHCVIGDRESKVGTYKEIVFFDEAQVYPEYAVIYKREYDPNKVDPDLRRQTKGTTGRFWQMKTTEGWKNLPTEVNKMLIEAMTQDTKQVKVTIGKSEYTFDVESKTGKNDRTGTEVALRAPMHVR